MPYKKAKIYADGSHYIAIPHEEHPEWRKKKTVSSTPDDKKAAFETAYEENKTQKKAKRTERIVEQIKDCFDSETEAREFVENNDERKQRNLIVKKTRLWRKLNLQEWRYFATFTYDDKKHYEQSFRKSLSNCLKHFASRKYWKYIGAWERSPEMQRLHFHALLFIPDGGEVGELKEVNDYDTISHKRQITYQNTFFNERFGRTDFKPICKQDISDTVGYPMKYIGKSNERLTYSRNLPQYFISDILDEDIACRCGIEDRKLLLFDSFTCIDDGEIIGQVSPEVIAKMPKSN